MIFSRPKREPAAPPLPTVLQARKPCGCVTAACLINYAGAARFRREYEAEGCTVEEVARTDATFLRTGGCPHRAFREEVETLIERYQSDDRPTPHRP